MAIDVEAGNVNGHADTVDLTNTRILDALKFVPGWANEQFIRIKNARSKIERQWYYNLAMYAGKQWVALQSTSNTDTGFGLTTKLYTPPAPYWRSRPVINRIRKTIRTEISQLTSNKPNVSVIPASADERDIYAANAAEQIWDNIYTNENVKAEIRHCMLWNQCTGNAFMKIFWDWNGGPVDPDTNKPEGRLKITHETPFHVFVPDFKEVKLDNQPYLIHAKKISADYARMFYGISSVGTINSKDLLEESFTNLLGISETTKNEDVILLECYVKPGCVSRFKNGAFFTVIGDKLVQYMEGLPHELDEYPFAKFGHILSGQFYCTSTIEDLIPLQREYNRTRGQIIENKNRMAKLQLLAPRGAVDSSKITSEPGLVIEYNPGLPKPEPMPLQGLPSYVPQELDRIKEDWNDISGQHEVTQGQVPPGVTAATAISYLQERDESILSVTFDSLEEGIEKVAKISLHMVHLYWTTPHTIKVTGADGAFDVLVFKGSDLKDNMDVKTEAGSSLPVSKAAKQALITDWMKMGFISADDGLEVLDMGGVNKIYEKIQVDRRQVQRENLRMSKVTEDTLLQYQQTNDQLLMTNPQHFGVDTQTGEPLQPPILVPVNSWDNHKIHIKYHNDFRKSQAFENLEDPVKALFEEHVQQHILALGIEEQTMDPRARAGLPPLPLGSDGQPQEQQQPSGTPGPEPMPDSMMQTEGAPNG